MEKLVMKQDQLLLQSLFDLLRGNQVRFILWLKEKEAGILSS